MSEIEFHVEGQKAQSPGRWEDLGIHYTEEQAREYMEDYKRCIPAWSSGWLGFRVVRVTITREPLS